MEAVITLLTVVQKIIKAAETVHGNQIRCQRLAVRAHDLGVTISVHRDSLTSTTEAGSGVTALLTTSPLESLTAVLEDALKLVEACQLRKSGFVGWVEDLMTSESMATRFQDVDTRITACVGDLNYAEGKAARLRDDRYRAKAQAPPAQEVQRQQQQRYQAQSAPPVKLSEQPWPSSLQSFLEQSAPPPPPPFTQPLPPSLQRFLEQSAPPSPPPQQLPALQRFLEQPVPPSTPPFKQPLPPSLQRFLEQSPPPSTPPQSMPAVQRFLQQSAPPPPPPFKQPLPPSLQRFLKQSAPPSMPPPQPMPALPPSPLFKQSAQPLPPSLQRFLKQSAPPPQQQHNVVQPLPQATPLLLLQRRYLA